METIKGMADMAFVYGFLIGAVVALLVVLRWPAFRVWWLELKVFGHPLIKSKRRGSK